MAQLVAFYAQLDFTRLPRYPHSLSIGSCWHDYLAWFPGFDGISTKQHLKAFDRFVDNMKMF